MKTKAAILRELPGEWDVVELELDEPRQGEVTIKLVGSGLCHSEMHFADGSLPLGHLPMIGGHEGAGIITAVGPNTPGFAEGDHVVLAAMATCGRCSWCAGGQGNLCDVNANIMGGGRVDDPTSFRCQLDGEPVGQILSLGAFAEYTTVNTCSVVKIDPDLPLDRACLVGCAVSTGWGSAVNMAEAGPGHTVIVMGAGGLGSFSVQGAAHAGATNIIAADPNVSKQKMALELGATHACSSIDEATEIGRSLTNGQGADSTIITVGHLERHHVGEGLASVRKGGTVVVTAGGSAGESDFPLNMIDLTLSQKRIQGSLYGGTSPMADIPKLLGMYAAGQLKLDEVVTREYSLDRINEGYRDLAEGSIVRGVITFG